MSLFDLQTLLKKHHPLYFLTLGVINIIIMLLLCLDSVCEETGDWPLDIDDLLRFSFQVAQGLDFLAAKNVSEFTTKCKCKHCDSLQLQPLSLESR